MRTQAGFLMSVPHFGMELSSFFSFVTGIIVLIEIEEPRNVSNQTPCSLAFEEDPINCWQLKILLKLYLITTKVLVVNAAKHRAFHLTAQTKADTQFTCAGLVRCNNLEGGG
ncbi:hypothetical protein V6N13_100188 [Hibiscus sabdariffa]|uniref:Uncharacterized protein n=2 Tax=Hibiscus sabdariffa TaxID=183260 RepID=A0ABR2B7Z7_9ROSI